MGEAVKAVVVLQPGHEPTDELTRELQQLVKDAKGSQQSPKSIDYVDAAAHPGRQTRQEGRVGLSIGTTPTERCRKSARPLPTGV